LLAVFRLQKEKTQPTSKMGAEKVSMNIVIVGQVQSAKAVKTVAKTAEATNQSIVSENAYLIFENIVFVRSFEFQQSSVILRSG